MPGATAQAAPLAAEVSARSEAIEGFYAARANRPLWFGEEGSAPQLLIDLLRTATADGLDPSAYDLDRLDRAVRDAWWGDKAKVDRADRLLSQAFVTYVRDVRRTPNVDMVWVDPELRPSAPSPRRLLEAAAEAPSLDAYLTEMDWTNPIYAALRRAIASGAAASPDQQELLKINLERARALPAGPARYVIVNTSAAQLTMYEGGKAVDSMRVVVGKPIYPTPMMAALIRFTSLNPYWNVPPDLAAERIAPNVVKLGNRYLDSKGYQVLASWDANAAVISPDSVDWSAVAAGRQEVRIRQLPGPANAMGKMKFMFPNAQGVYLHDTPERNLLGEETRLFSGGCVRLEDAARLARWLYNGRPPEAKVAGAEQRVDLPAPVPVYLTYLTALPADGGIVYLPDVYKRDGAALAEVHGKGNVATR